MQRTSGNTAVTMPLRAILGLALLLAVQPAQAEESFLDRLFGGRSGAVPPNPFASNYPSAAPTPEDVRAARARRAAHAGRSAKRGPLPPGRIPE